MTNTTNYCSRCKKTDVDLIRYSRSKSGKKQYYRCNPCNTRHLNLYRKTVMGKKSVLRARLKYEKNNPLKVLSWQLAKCIKATPCIVCGNPKVDRHHQDSSKPLEVIMLCRKHHKEAHYKESKK